jgi:hypothetical protein
MSALANFAILTIKTPAINRVVILTMRRRQKDDATQLKKMTLLS